MSPVIEVFTEHGWPDWGSRFAGKVVRDESSGCWLWHRVPNGGRYAQFWLDNRRPVAHRLLWEYVNGPVPDGLHLDHLCRTRHCVNPAHLEPVTPWENVHRSPIASATQLASRTHCNYGHEFSPENTRIRTDRYSRRCRTCMNSESRLRKRRDRTRAKCYCGRPVPLSNPDQPFCAEHDDVTASIARHPSGKGLPA